ncbi:MAG: hypothetical protein PHI12_12555 [Dehalococcoidales bacterium]|nr:hypothetical protein [Dehalococcoidales bacterium]
MPTGDDLTSGELPGDQLPVAIGDWVSISLTPYELTQGTQYAIVVRIIAGGFVNVFWQVDGSTPTYEGGMFVRSADSGGSWVAEPTYDAMFEIYSGAQTTELSGTINGQGSFIGLLGVYANQSLGGSFVGTGSLGGGILLKPNWRTERFKTIQHLVAIGNDEVWSETMAGTMTQVAASVGEINTSDMLSAFEAFQKVFIVNGANKKVLDFINDKLTVAAPLTTPPLAGDTLTQAASGAAMIVDAVSADKTTIYGYRITDATFDTTNSVTSDNEGGDTMGPSSFVPATATSRSSGPFWYDWVPHPSKITQMPVKAYLSCLYRGRAVLAGNPEDPHQWYMSRQADLFDWDFASNDAQSAVAGTNADAGKVGDVIRALVPYHDDYLFFGCANSIWLLDGDPAAGGTLQPLSDTEGMHGAYSWCFDSEGNLWFWGTSGICVIPPGPGKPVCRTAHILPKLLDEENIDPARYRIVFGYDKKRTGIFISITKLADGTNSCYWFDLKTEGLFPERYPEQCGAYSIHYYHTNDDGLSDLLVGCRDGYIRHWDDAAKDDDIGLVDQAIDSYAVVGPAAMGNPPGREGTLSGVQIETGGGNIGGAEADSDPITYSIYTDLTAGGVIEKAIANNSRLTRTVLAPGCRRGTRNRQVVRGAFGAVQLRNNTKGQSWAVEKLVLNE